MIQAEGPQGTPRPSGRGTHKSLRQGSGAGCVLLQTPSSQFAVLPHQAKTMTDVSSQKSKVFFDGTINLSQEEKSSHGTEDGSSL